MPAPQFHVLDSEYASVNISINNMVGRREMVIGE